MTKEELVEKLFPNAAEMSIPQQVVYVNIVTTEDLYEEFHDYFIDEFGDKEDKDLEDIFTQMWEEKKEEFFGAEPPSEWGWEHAEIIYKWVKNYKE